MSISPEQRMENLEKAVFSGPNPQSVPVTEITADGSLDTPGKAGLRIITKATACSLTLLPPVAGADDGKELRVLSKTAAAHTVTTASNKINGNKSTANFGGAVGDFLTLIAFGGT